MAITLDNGTLVFTIPQSDLVSLGGNEYELNTETKLRADINALMDNENEIVLATPITHNTEITFGGVTYARTIEFINGYTITFSTEAAPYRVNLIGSNNNLTDVLNLSDASVIPSNSAGLANPPEIKDMLGLGSENVSWSAITFDANNNMTAARINQYEDNTLTTIRKSWDMTATYNSNNEMTAYQMIEV